MAEARTYRELDRMIERLEDGFSRGCSGYVDDIGHVTTLAADLSKRVPISVVARKTGTNYDVTITVRFTIDADELPATPSPETEKRDH